MSDENQNTNDDMLNIGGESFSLTDVAGIDMSEIEEVRFTPLPKGLYRWKCERAYLSTKTIPVSRGSDEKTKVGTINFECSVADVVELNTNRDDPNSLINRKQTVEFIFGGDNPKLGLGRAKAFMLDAGLKTNSRYIEDLLSEFEGIEFLAPIRHIKNENDPEMPYSRINDGKVKPVTD